MRIRSGITASVVLLLVIIAVAHLGLAQQVQTGDPLAVGIRQLEAAWIANTESAFETAQDTFAKVLASDPDNPKALVYQGEAKMMRAYLLASQGKYGPSAQFLQSGMADMDRAVTLAPNRADIRLERGLNYGPMASYIDKSSVARDDLESAMRDSQFKQLAKDQQARAYQALGIVYTNLKDVDKALNAFRTSIAADPESRFGKDSAERMKTLAAQGLHPDRFPKIADQVSPLVAAVSITYVNASAGKVPDQLQTMTRTLANFPGSLATHLLSSADKPGMFVLFTWWKNKQALNEFYYSDLHQALMNDRGRALTSTATPPNGPAVSQLSVEVLGQFPAGIQVNGGFIPKELFGGQSR